MSKIDFTEVRPGRYGYRYMLVLEAFPTKKETARTVAKVLLEEVIPR